MFSFNLGRWLKSKSRSRVRTFEKKPRFRLSVEQLETRLAPAQFIWTGNAGTGLWSTAANWLGGVAPSPSSPLADLVFDSRGGTNLTANNNVTGLTVNSIQVSNLGNYNLTGNLITLGDPATSGSGTIQIGVGLAGETIAMDIQLAAAFGSQQFINVGSGSVLTLSGHLSGITGSQLTKRGTGTLNLTNDNSTYVGPVSIEHDAGIVNVTHADALGGTLTSAVQAITLTNPSTATRFTLSFGFGTTAPIAYTGTQADAAAVLAALNGLGAINSGGGFVLVTQTNTATTETFTITFAGGKAESARALINPTITAGPGTASASDVVIGGVATTNKVTVGVNSQLQLNDVVGGAINNPLQLFGPGATNTGSLINVAGNNVWSGTVSMGTNTSFNVNTGTSLEISGVVDDLGSPFNVEKIGGGELIFSTANSYRGATTITDGILTIQHRLALGAVASAGTTVSRSTVFGTAGTLRLQATSGAGFTVANVPLILNGPGFAGSGALENFQGDNVWTGPITLGSIANGSAPTIAVDAFGGADTSFLITGVIRDRTAGAPFSLTKTGTGNLILAPETAPGSNLGTANLYQGTTSIQAGTVTLRDSQGLGPKTKTALTTVANGATLALESNVGHVDSVTGAVNRLGVSSRLNITGPGYNNVGALHSISGLNVYTSAFVQSPVQSPITGVFGGGLLAGTTYHYIVTALDGYGESLASNEESFTATPGNQTAQISWSQVPGAIGYRIYRTTVAGQYGAASLKTAINSGTILSFDDTTVGLLAGSPPTQTPVITLGGTGAAIGVDVDPTPSADISYLTNDFSLSILGGISGTANQALAKAGAGHLILPNANNQFLGNTDIDAGWISVQNPNSLGPTTANPQELQPTIAVDAGAALHLKPLVPGTSLTLTQNLLLQGSGISHPYSLINQLGALENLAGVNTVAGNIRYAGPVGIGVEKVFPGEPSHLTLTGEASQTLATFNFSGSPSGGAAQSIGPGPGGPVDTGSTSGTLIIDAFVHSVGDDIRIYLGNWVADPAGARLIYDASNDFVSAVPTATNQFAANIVVNYTATSATITVTDLFDPGPGPSGTGTGWLYEGLGPQIVSFAPVPAPYSTWLTVVVNPGRTGFGFTVWDYQAQIIPGVASGSIAKLGSQRLDLQGPGIFTGGVDVREGVLRVQNDAALGAPAGGAGTVVQPGAALELAPTVAELNGGLSSGISTWDHPLTLSGNGNSEFGLAPLTVSSHDNLWHGPITLRTNIAMEFQGALAGLSVNTLSAITTDQTTGAPTLTGTGPSVLVVKATPGGAGVNAVQMLSFGGTITGGFFMLRYNDGVNPPATTGNINWDADLNVLVANIRAALAPIFGAGAVNVFVNSPTVNVLPNARFVVAGKVDDGATTVTVANPLIHDYQLNNSFADALGGPSLVPVGGTLGPTGFSWSAVPNNNEGLTLTGALPDPANYSIEMVFHFDNAPAFPNTWAAIIDFKDRAVDNLLYARLDALDFFGFATGPGLQFSAGVDVHLVITRSAVTNNFTAYINGVQQVSLTDSGNDGVFSGPGNIIRFFQDNLGSAINEIDSGFVDEIRIYSRPLTAGEVVTVFNGGTLGSVIQATGTPADITLSGGGELVLAGNNTFHGTTFVNQGTLTLLSGQALGDIGIGGGQQLALIGAVPGSTQFQMSFGAGAGSQTAVIPYTGTAADAVNIQNELNNLATIGGVSGFVTVTQRGAGVFLITFGGGLADITGPLVTAKVTSGFGSAGVAAQGGTFIADKAQLQLQGGITVASEPLTVQGTGASRASTVQTFTVGSTSPSPSGTFTLNFNGSDTAPLPFDATAGQVRQALQNLPSVVDVGGSVSVNVTDINPGLQETQRITFSGFNVGDQYNLYFDPSGGPLTPGVNVTSALTFTNNPYTDRLNIVNALNALQTVRGASAAGGVRGGAVSYIVGGETIELTFVGGLGQQDLVPIVVTVLSGTGAAAVDEVAAGTTGSRSFAVYFQGSFAQQDQPLLTVTGTTGDTVVTNVRTAVAGGSNNATPTQWFTQGPAPVINAQVFNGGGAAQQDTTGRVTGVAVQPGFPDHIVISTAGGGVWKTVDGGQHWTPLFDKVAGDPAIFTGAVTVAQAGTDALVYVGTGEGNNSGDSYYGTGVYLNGKVLTNPDGSNPLIGKAVNRIVVDPNNPLVIWVAVGDLAVNGTFGDAGVWRYDGLNWVNLTFGLFPDVFVSYSDLAYDSATGRLYAAFGDPIGAAFNDIIHTGNPGAAVPAWTSVGVSARFANSTNLGNIKLAVASPNEVFASVATGSPNFRILGILRTANGGGTWATVTTPPEYLSPQGDYNSSIVASGNTVYVGGVDQAFGTNNVLVSVNDGGAWTDISKDALNFGPHTDVHAMVIDSNGRLVVGADGGVWRYDPSAATWSNLNGNLNTIQLNGVAIQPGGTGVILGGAQDNGIFRYDGTAGQGWSQVDVGDGGLVRFVPTDPSVAYHVVPFGGAALMKSTDGGLSWTGPITTVPGFYTPFAVDPLNPQRVVIVGGNQVRESLNQGTSFSNVPNVPINNISGLALATYQGVFRADPAFPSVADAGANTYVPDTLYIANDIDLRVTKNHGLTWSGNRAPLLTGTGNFIQSIMVDPSDSNVLYLVTNGFVGTPGSERVFKSVDSGQSWTDISAGLPDVPGLTIALDVRTSDLYLGTDHGVWKLTRGTGAWERFGAGLPNVQVTDLQLDMASNVLAAATYGRGVWFFYLNDNTLPDAPAHPGALRSVSGNNNWTGPIHLAGPTVISVSGSQALQNGLSAATLNLFGAISDASPTAANTLTKVGGGDLILNGVNTYTGVSDVQAGNLIIHNPNALGGAASPGVQAISVVSTLAPTQNAPTLTDGGTFGLGTTVFYVITAVGPLGESIASNVRQITTTEVAQSVVLSWVPVAGASSYNIYRATSAGGFGSSTLLTTVAPGTTSSFIDIGDPTAVGAPPILQLTLSFDGFTSATPITLTGTPADAAAIQSALNDPSFATIGGSGASVSVVSTNPGLFVVTFNGSLAGTNKPILASLASGFGAASTTVGGGTIVQSGAALELETDLNAESITLNGHGIQTGYSGHHTGSLRSLSNNNVFTGTITLNTSATIGVDTGSTLTIDGAGANGIVDHGKGYSLDKDGPGTLILADANAYGGVGAGTQVHQGVLNVRNSQALGAAGGVTTVRNGAQLQLEASAGGPVDILDQNLILSGSGIGGAGAILNVGGNNTWGSAATTLTLSAVPGFSPVTTPAGAVTFGVADAADMLTIAGLIVEPGASDAPTTGPLPSSLVKVGPGTLALAQSNSYTGTTYINEGVLRVQNSGALGLNDGDEIQRVTIFDDLGNNDFTLTFKGQTTGLLAFGLQASGGFGPTASVQNALAALSTIGVGNVAVARSTITLDTPNGTQIGYVYTITFLGALAKQGQPLLAVTPTGGLQASVARIADGGVGALVSSGAALEVDGSLASVNVPTTERLILNGTGVGGAGALRNVAGDNSWAGPVTLQTSSSIGADLASALSITGNVQDPATGLIPPPNLTKVGEGTLIFPNANTYTGNTFVNDGALRIQNPGSLGVNTSAVQTVNVSGTSGTFTLSFNGTPTSPLTIGATADQVKSALDAVVQLGNPTNFVTVTQAGNVYTITFNGGALAGKLQPVLGASFGVGINSVVVTPILPGGSSSNTVAAGASLQLAHATSFTEASGKSLFLNGDGFNNGGALQNVSGDNVWVNNPIILASDASVGADAGTHFTIDQVITDNQQVQAITFTGFSSGNQYRLSFNGNTTGVLTFSNSGNTNATNIRNALNALPIISLLGGVVSVPSPGFGGGSTFNVSFGGRMRGATWPTIVATPVTGGGSINVNPNAAPTSSGFDFSKFGAGTVEEIGTASNTYTGVTTVVGGTLLLNKSAGATAVPDDLVVGNLGVAEVQTVTVTGTEGTFTLTFDGQTTGPLAFDASQGQVQAALNALSNIGQVGGSVSVTRAANVYTVTFGGTLRGADLPQIEVANVALATAVQGGTFSDVQTITVVGDTNGTFNVTFHTQTTVDVALNVPATGGTLPADSLQNALEALPAIGAGNVAVTEAGGVYTITFIGALADVDQQEVTVNFSSGGITTVDVATVQQGGTFNDVQTATVNGLSGTFTLTFNGQTTVALPFDVPATGGLNAVDSLQNALNALSSIGGAGGFVNVSQAGNVYTITFGGSLASTDQPAITAVDVTVATGADGARFGPGDGVIARLLGDNQIANNAIVTVRSDGLLDINGHVEAINSLVTVDGHANVNGGVLTPGSINMTGGLISLPTPTSQLILGGNVTALSDAAGSAVIQGTGVVSLNGATRTFTVNEGPADSDLQVFATITGVNGIVKTGPGRLQLGVANTYAGVTQINGGDVQVDSLGRQNITLSGFLPTNQFTLTFRSQTTGPITYSGSGATDAARIQAALNLPTIIGATGTVSVIAIGTDTFAVTFGGSLANADLAPMTATVLSGAGTVSIANARTIGGVLLNGGSVSGVGTVSTIGMLNATAAGTVDPGTNGEVPGMGILDTAGDVVWTTNTTFFVDLMNTTPGSPPVAGSDYDQLYVVGSINLGNALLQGSPGAGIQVGDEFTIVQATGTVTGLFEGIIAGIRAPIPDGGTVFLNGQKFVVHYFSDRVVLSRQLNAFTSFTMAVSTNPSVYGQEVTYTVTAVPEPGATLATAAPFITFSLDSGVYTQTVALNPANGVATFTPQSHFGLLWAPGTTINVTATFTDLNAVFVSTITPTPGSITQVVNQNTVGLTLASNPVVTATAPQYGQSIEIVATILPNVIPNVPNASNPTGNVTFVVDNSAALTFSIPINPYQNPPSAEKATLTLPGSLLLSPGTHTVTASYNGDPNFAGTVTPVSFVFTVKTDATTVAFTPAPAPSFLGRPAVFNVVVNPSVPGSIGIPTGTLNFYNGSTSNPPLNPTPIPYSGGTATFSIGNLLVGTHNIIARFTPSNTNFTGSTQTVSFTVNPATTATSFVSTAPNAPTFGQAVTFNMRVAPNPAINPSFGVPTGTVTLWDGPVGTGIILGTGSVNSGTGIATITTTALALSQGSHTLNAAYSGNAQFGASIGTLNLTVGKAVTNVAISASPSAGASYGQNVTLTATVTTPIGTLPTGAGSTVTFMDVTTGTTLGTANVGAGGVASIATSALTAGAHVITATYADTVTNNYASSVGTLNNYTISNAPTTTTITNISPASGIPVYGEPISITASVTSPSGPVTVGAGSTVRFVDTSTGAVLGTANVVAGGVATLVTTVLSAGTHTITATYTNTANTFFASSNGSTSGYAVNQAQTLISAFTSSSPTSGVGQSVTFSATVSAQSPSVATVNQGSVTFFDLTTGQAIGTGAVNAATGVASVATTALAAGTHNIQAQYNGGANFAGSTAVNLTQTVRNASVVNVGPVINALFGQTLTYVITVTSPQGGTPSGTVTLTEGATTLASDTLIGGTVTFSISDFSVGAHPLVFSYSGSTAGVGYVSSSKAFTQNVSPSPTTTELAAGQSTVVFGDTVSYTATVTAASGAHPTQGTVTLKDVTKNVVIDTVELNGSNVALFQNVGLPTTVTIGAHVIKAFYTDAPNGNYGNSPLSLGSNLVVQQVFTEVVDVSSSETSGPLGGSYYGQPVTFTATVQSTNSAATPNGGTVTFRRGAVVLATVPLVNGVASYTTKPTQLPVQTGTGHLITATYNSSKPAARNVASFRASVASAPLIQFVSKVATQVNVVASAASGDVSFGHLVTLTATVSVISPGTPGSLAGTVTFWQGPVGTGKRLGAANVNATTGRAVLNTYGLQASAGDDINAVFVSKKATFENATGAIASYVVNQAETETTLVSAPTFWGVGQLVRFTATVKAISGGRPGTPTGFVDFSVDGAPPTRVRLAAGKAVFSVRFNDAGDHTVVADYVPTQNYAESSAQETQNVRIATAASLTSVPTQQGVTLNGRIVPLGGGGFPAGTVSFFKGAVLLGTAVLDANGFASLFVNTLPPGGHTITLVYDGDALFNPATRTARVLGRITGRLV